MTGARTRQEQASLCAVLSIQSSKSIEDGHVLMSIVLIHVFSKILKSKI